MTLPILKQIADLHGMPQDQLKALWQEYFGTEPPAYRKGFLVKGLAQRIQELTFGGLAAAHQTKLNALVEDKPVKRRAPEAGTSLLPGTKLVRDWQGVTQCHQRKATVRSDSAIAGTTICHLVYLPCL